MSQQHVCISVITIFIAHRASVHSRTLGKAGTKQARTLELEFTLAPRPRANPLAQRRQQQQQQQQ
jgi:hypothetical protein